MTKSYYTGKQARLYNRIWRHFTQKTLEAVISAIDIAELRQRAEARGEPLRILDVACGTGVLLQNLSAYFPHARLYGIDASSDMLVQARLLLKDSESVHLSQGVLTTGFAAGLPCEPASFDLITCTNALHYLSDPASVLRGLRELLTPHGQLIVEDYARRTFPFPWPAFEWLIKRIDAQHVRAFTIEEAQQLCLQAGLQVLLATPFSIDLLWQGWVIKTAL